MRSPTSSICALSVTALVGAACLLSAGPALAKPHRPVGKYKVDLHSAIDSSASINWDNRDGHLDAGCCFSASGKIEASWSSDVKTILTFDRHGRLKAPRTFSALFLVPGLASPFESAGKVHGNWAGIDDTYGPATGSDPPHDYSCNYSLEASSIPGAAVAWQVAADPKKKANVLVSFAPGAGDDGHPTCTGYQGNGYPGNDPLGADTFLQRPAAFNVSVPGAQLVKHSSRSIGPRDVACDSCAGPAGIPVVHSVGAFHSDGRKKK